MCVHLICWQVSGLRKQCECMVSLLGWSVNNRDSIYRDMQGQVCIIMSKDVGAICRVPLRRGLFRCAAGSFMHLSALKVERGVLMRL